jgi:hypothetical protein
MLEGAVPDELGNALGDAAVAALMPPATEV